MSIELVIRFTVGQAVDSELSHRVRNFAEDLQRSLSRASIGTVENPNRALHAVFVRVESKRMLGKAIAAAKAELKRHNLANWAVVQG